MRRLFRMMFMAFCRWYFQCEKLYKMGDHHACFYGPQGWERVMQMLEQNGFQERHTLIECYPPVGEEREITSVSKLEVIQ